MLPDEQSGQNPWIGGIRQDASDLCYGDCSSEYVQALREHLGIDQGPSCHYRFAFGSQKHDRYSDNALTKMSTAAALNTIADVLDRVSRH